MDLPPITKNMTTNPNIGKFNKRLTDEETKAEAYKLDPTYDPTKPAARQWSQNAAAKEAINDQKAMEQAAIEAGVARDDLVDAYKQPKESWLEREAKRIKSPAEGLAPEMPSMNKTAANDSSGNIETQTLSTDKSIEDVIADSKQNYGLVDDYYGNSMSEMWKNLSPEDKKILALDQLGTSLKNISKARLPMYSAYGKSYEGEGVGDEKSMLQKGVQESFKAGLERRNSRLNSQMDSLLKQANFPSNLSMQLKTLWESGNLNNKQKTNFIKLMSNVDFMDALKAGVVSIAANGQILNQAGSLIGSLL